MAKKTLAKVSETATLNQKEGKMPKVKKAAKKPAPVVLTKKTLAALKRLGLTEDGWMFHFSRQIAVGIVKDSAFRGHKFWHEKHEAREARVWDIHKPEKYNWHTNAMGKKVYDIGDSVAEDLRDLTLVEVYDFASRELKIDTEVLMAAYGHLNNGQQRMNLGNKLRKARKDKAA